MSQNMNSGSLTKSLSSWERFGGSLPTTPTHAHRWQSWREEQLSKTAKGGAAQAPWHRPLEINSRKSQEPICIKVVPKGTKCRNIRRKRGNVSSKDRIFIDQSFPSKKTGLKALLNWKFQNHHSPAEWGLRRTLKKLSCWRLLAPSTPFLADCQEGRMPAEAKGLAGLRTFPVTGEEWLVSTTSLVP